MRDNEHSDSFKTTRAACLMLKVCSQLLNKERNPNEEMSENIEIERNSGEKL